MSERPTEGLPDNGPDTADSQGGTLEELVDRLEAGALSLEEQRRLAGFLAAEHPELVMAATRHESYSGPLPHPDLLNRSTMPHAAQSCRWPWMSRRMPIGCGNAVWKAPLQRTVGGSATVW